MALLLGLLLAASPDAATVSVSPAPGAPAAHAIVVSGRTVLLDVAGRARIPAGAAPSAEGLRFSAAEGASEVLYYPATSALATWALAGVDATGSASVVWKEHEGSSWEDARTVTATLEKTTDGRRVRFAIPPGLWDAAIVVPGFAPAFVVELEVYEDDETLRVAATTLQPAGRVVARVLDDRTGRPPELWEARVSRVVGDPEDEETKFFDGWPIAKDAAALDFSSLPVGQWELSVGAPHRSARRSAFAVLKPRERKDLGDLYLSDKGALHVTVSFPAEVPAREFACTVARPTRSGDGRKTELASKAFTPEASSSIKFTDLETGFVAIDCGDGADIHEQKTATVVSGETAEVEFSFAPVNVSGFVRRGDEPVPGATVTSHVSGPGERTIEAVSDDFGAYQMVVWPSHEMVVLLTTPPEDRLPFVEKLDIEEGTTELEHDVLLPSLSIRGIVRDKETGEVLPAADVQFSGSLAPKGSEWGHFSMRASPDEEGKFRLGNLLDQPLEVEVTLEGYAPFVRKDVVPTPEGTELDVRLEKGNRLTGMVVDELGAPIPGVEVGLDVDSGGDNVQRTETTSVSGEFDFGPVAFGPHVLSAFRCGSTFALQTIDVNTYESEPPPRIVRLRPAVRPIELQVVDENGEPVSQAVFRWSIGGLTVPLEDWARATQGCGHEFRTDAQGKLHLHGFPAGVIGAASLDRVPLGTFSNDGSDRRWTLRLPSEEEHVEAQVRAASH